MTLPQIVLETKKAYSNVEECRLLKLSIDPIGKGTLAFVNRPKIDQLIPGPENH